MNTSPSPAAVPVIHGDSSTVRSRNAHACKSRPSSASATAVRDDATTLRGRRLRTSTNVESALRRSAGSAVPADVRACAPDGTSPAVIVPA